MTRRHRLLRIYVRIGRTYRAWARHLLGLAILVFIPLGFVDALLEQVDTSSLNVTSVSSLRMNAFLPAPFSCSPLSL